MGNKLIVASAGSGKTTYLIDQALGKKSERVLITTYTRACEAEIRDKIVKKNKCVPPNITIQTWFSFLLQHGVRPYQGYFFEGDIKEVHMTIQQSARGVKKNESAYYFDEKDRIYSDKISDFAIKCNKESQGKVLDRLSRIYSHIFIDEVQDLAGHDLELLKDLFNSPINMLLMCDPRQGTYSTNNAKKNKKFAKGNIISFFKEMEKDREIEIDSTSLNTNYRSISAICDLSNKVFPAHQATQSGNTKVTGHDGVFLVRKRDIEAYLAHFKPMQLRNSKTEKGVGHTCSIMNFGESKGLSFDRVLIYPTKPFVDWLKNNKMELKEESRSRLYVAITRARYSVGFVYDWRDGEEILGATKFDPSTLEIS